MQQKFRRTAQALALAASALLWGAGCSGNAGGEPVAINYTGDPVADFVQAVEFGDAKMVENLLRDDPSLLGLQDEAGQSALHYAVLNNRAAVVTLLIERGLDPNIRDLEGRTPLTVLEDSGFRAEDARSALMKHGGTN